MSRKYSCAYAFAAMMMLLQGISYHMTAANLPDGFAEVRVAQGLDPTAMAIAPDGRIFIAEKNGRLLVVENGMLRSEPVLVLDLDNYNERGLSGIAVHPGFSNNGFIYLYYTLKDVAQNRISRFTILGNQVVQGSETVILDLDPDIYTVHMGGSMSFGPDGKLYVSVGDGANGNKAQDMSSLLGKVLRLNDDGSIPEDNPFFQEAKGIYRAIYALGFRNSFSMAIHPVTGRIMATEVGSAYYEEVNEVLPGMNYGWPVIEGPLTDQTPPNQYMDPVYAYDHGKGCAAVGAAFYSPETLLFPSEYTGMFFFADYCHGYIKYLDPDNPAEIRDFATGISRPLNLLVAPDGSLYYLARAGMGGGSEEDNTASTNGSLWRVFYNASGAPFLSTDPQPVFISDGESAQFTAQASGTQPIYYQWQRNQADIPGAIQKTYLIPVATLSDSGSLFRCIATNLAGADTTAEAVLRVTSNQRPVPQILSPEDGLQYKGGDVIAFSGIITDAEQGELPLDVYRWWIDFHHDQHTHPALAPTSGITGGDYFIPQVGETSTNVWYTIHLVGEDAGGLSGAVTREIHPVRTQFVLRTDPPGISVFLDGKSTGTPGVVNSVAGIIRRLEARQSVVRGDSILIFREWSNGVQDPVLVIAAEEDTLTYTAIYESAKFGKGTGMQGYYYDGPPYDPTFYEPYAFSRTDAFIDFEWGEGTPSEEDLGDDFWLVRWEGFVEPLVDDHYTFHVLSDDGSRLWVNDSLIVNAWMNQPPVEWSGSIHLDAGRYYPLRLEYFESGGGARCRLSWSSDRLDKRTIQQSQLYPEEPVSTVIPLRADLRIYPNPANRELLIEFPEHISGDMETELYNILGQRVRPKSVEVQDRRITMRVDHLPPGMYWIVFRQEDGFYGPAGFIRE